MRKSYHIFLVMVLSVSCALLVSCEAITAQNITNTGNVAGMNGSQGMNGSPNINGGNGMNGGPRDNGNFMHGMMNADLTGKIVSINGNTVKIELVERTQDNGPVNPNNGQQNTNGNQNSGGNDKRSQRGFQDSMFKTTGVEKTFTVSNDADISQGMARPNQNDNTKSSMKLSDLKKGQIIMVWYKKNTETVERISVMGS